jgi:hypothetical protein
LGEEIAYVARVLKNWLTAYLDYAAVSEAPRIMHFYAGVGALGGALRRKVWIDMKRFIWTPNFFIIFVAPPGIVSKSTTADVAMDLLRQVPGIKFGPDVVTWPALVSAFAAAGESFQYGEDWIPMSPLTLVASELGNLLNPQDRDMVNLFINLWDGRKSLEKVTKGSGNDTVEAPWVNMLGCTTPHWIADNMPSATVGGGFTSRCIFVYADRKDKFVAYVDESVASTDAEKRADLIHDLEHISVHLTGPYAIERSAREWGRDWYERNWTQASSVSDDDRLAGYVARKQTHLHKLAIVIAASERDELVITKDDLILAETMLTSVEGDLDKVFSRIGRTEDSLQAERFIQFIRKKESGCAYEEAYQYIHAYFPDFKAFEGILSGAVRAGYVTLGQKGNQFWLTYTGPKEA